jgi:hypothetical protein
MVTIGQLTKGILLVASVGVLISSASAAETNSTPVLVATQATSPKVTFASLRRVVVSTPIKSSRDEGFDRYTSIFSGPPGPTMPLGATLNPTADPSGYFQSTVIRVSASSTLVVYDLPPGARRATTASVSK